MAGVVHGRCGVITGAHQRELVRDLRVQRKNLGDLDVRVVGPNRLEGSPDLAWGIRFHIPGVQLARSAQVENHDHGLLVLALGHGAHGLQRGQVGERETQGAQGADLEEVATRDSVAGGD